jgi:hypothetical protein
MKLLEMLKESFLVKKYVAPSEGMAGTLCGLKRGKDGQDCTMLDFAPLEERVAKKPKWVSPVFCWPDKAGHLALNWYEDYIKSRGSCSAAWQDKWIHPIVGATGLKKQNCSGQMQFSYSDFDEANFSSQTGS